MDLGEVEERANKIIEEIKSLHEDLFESEWPCTAWLHDIPGLAVEIEPNTNDVLVSIKIGRSENA